MKKIAVLPTLLTLGNGVCGFIAIVIISKIIPENKITTEELMREHDGYFAWAGWFILFAMLFDMLDGYVARLTRTASDFGGELDSLCDVVSFGVTPAFLLLKLGPSWNALFDHVLVGIAALYFSCTALRLARFNVENDPDPASHKRFRGLPSPGAAGCIAALAILRGPGLESLAARETIIRLVEIISPLGALVVALLMVSKVPYPHLTSKIFTGKKSIGRIIQVLLAGVILLMFRSLAPFLVFWIYAFIFPMRVLFVRNLRPEEGEGGAPPPVDEHAPRQL